MTTKIQTITPGCFQTCFKHRISFLIFLLVTVIVFYAINAFAATPLPVIDISGGENHTLVLGENNRVTGCGDNTGRNW